MLPQTARIRVAVDPSCAWGWVEHLLADAAYSLRWLVWSKTTDGSKNRNRPKRILPPGVEVLEDTGMTINKRNTKGLVLVSHEYLVRLSTKRKEVRNGN